jgi:hypothetical protein
MSAQPYINFGGVYEVNQLSLIISFLTRIIRENTGAATSIYEAARIKGIT